MKQYYPFSALVLLALLLSSCSGGNGGYSPGAGTDPVGALTSQMEVSVAKVQQGEFQSDLGYTITLSQVMITMADVEVATGSGHTHGIRHEETGPEIPVGSTLKGVWKVYPYAGKTILGVAQANPGSYDTLSFSIAPEVRAHGAPGTDEEVGGAGKAAPSVIVEGTAAKGGAPVPFRAHLPMDGRTAVSGLAIEFHYGHYLPVHLVFPVSHWLDGVDFNTLAATAGTIYINGVENTAAADTMTATILHHVHVHTGETAEGREIPCRGPAPTCVAAGLTCPQCSFPSKLRALFSPCDH